MIRIRRSPGIRFQLVMGLAAIILVSSLATYAGSFVLARDAFQRLVEQGDLQVARSYADLLADFWGQNHGWAGVADHLRGLRTGGDHRPIEGDPVRSDPRRESSDPPLVVTDEAGNPVYNGFHKADRPDAAAFPAQYRTDRGEAVAVGGRVVGYVFFKTMVLSMYNPREEQFLQALTLSSMASVLLGIASACLLGLVLASRFVRPILRLDAAVKSIAGGDLGSRVTVRGSREIARLSDNFNRMADRLAADEKARRNLVADVAHELRTPVTVLQANLEMLIEGVYQPDRDRLKSLYDETVLLTKLIGDLRTLSDLELGLVQVQTEPVCLGEVVGESCAKFSALLAEKGIGLDLDAGPPGQRVRADAWRVMQVIGNILDNAVKYASDTPVLTVSVAPSPDRPGFLRASFSDTGPGVAEGEAGALFDRFYRAERSRNRQTGGRGLGLAISRRLIEACGGAMGALHRRPRGLTVWFDLRLQGEED